MSADLGTNSVLQRGYDLASRGVILGVGAEHQENIQRQSHRITLNLHVALLHDVE